MATDTWASLDDVRDDWADAPMNDDVLDRLIGAAHGQLAAYAPPLPDGAPIPANYVLAECLQTRALGQALDRDGDVLGFGDGFAVRVRPLTGDVKALLRPRDPSAGPR